MINNARDSKRKEENIMPYVLATIGALAETGASTVNLDFSDALTTSLTGILADYGKYALIAIPIGLSIWGAPKAISMVKRFFNSLSR